jgi:hypothetical protein
MSNTRFSLHHSNRGLTVMRINNNKVFKASVLVGLMSIALASCSNLPIPKDRQDSESNAAQTEQSDASGSEGKIYNGEGLALTAPKLPEVYRNLASTLEIKVFKSGCEGEELARTPELSSDAATVINDLLKDQTTKPTCDKESKVIHSVSIPYRPSFTHFVKKLPTGMYQVSVTVFDKNKSAVLQGFGTGAVDIHGKGRVEIVLRDVTSQSGSLEIAIKGPLVKENKDCGVYQCSIAKRLTDGKLEDIGQAKIRACSREEARYPLLKKLAESKGYELACAIVKQDDKQEEKTTSPALPPDTEGTVK